MAKAAVKESDLRISNKQPGITTSGTCAKRLRTSAPHSFDPGELGPMKPSLNPKSGDVFTAQASENLKNVASAPLSTEPFKHEHIRKEDQDQGADSLTSAAQF